jgi:phosphoglycerate kinase
MTRSAPLAPFPTLDDAQLTGKRVLVRVDLNVPMEDGQVTDATRIDRILPNLRELAGKGAKVIILSHLGRPKNGRDAKYSLRPVVDELKKRLEKNVGFAEDCIGEAAEAAVAAMADGDYLLLENTRFHKGEEKNHPDFVTALARLGDVYVDDSFSTAHRAHASTEGLAHRMPSFAGRSMQVELEILTNLLTSPVRPVMAIVGGAKVSTKLELLGNLMRRVDRLVIGGGMANTFLAAMGKAIGKSFCEMEFADIARKIMADAGANCEVVLPVDVVVAPRFEAHAQTRIVDVDHVGEDDMILDIGPKSVAKIEALLDSTRTLVWNGPFGAFEIPPFDAGTVAVAKAAARLTKSGQLESVAGGGDTIAALNKADAAKAFTYISTAGGAFLEWLEGKSLPGVEALRNSFRPI